jgi:hypothetical protein
LSRSTPGRPGSGGRGLGQLPRGVAHLQPGDLRRQVRTEEQPQEVDIPQPTLVALGAIAASDDEILGQAIQTAGVDFKKAFSARRFRERKALEEQGEEDRPETRRLRWNLALQDGLEPAIETFQKAFDGHWPPTPEQIRAFCDLSGTIRD